MANLTRAVLRRLFSFAMAVGVRRDNPFNAITAYKIGTYHTWTDDQLAAYEKRWPLGTRERLGFDLLLYTAQRVGDVVRMQRSHIRNGVLAVTQQKTGTEVFIPVHPALARSIKAGPAKGLYLIGDRNGRPIKGDQLSALIAAVLRQRGCLRNVLRTGCAKPHYAGLPSMVPQLRRCRLFLATKRWLKLSAIRMRRISSALPRQQSVCCPIEWTKIEQRVANLPKVSQLWQELS